MQRVRILVLNAALGALDYSVPAGMQVTLGSLVLAPLGPRQIMGIVWDPQKLYSEPVDDSRLRPILQVLPTPPLSAALRQLIQWTADYYCASLGAVARMAIVAEAAVKGGGTAHEYRLTGEVPERMTPQRAIALETLTDEQGTLRELSEIAGVSIGVLRGMQQQGMLEAISVSLDRPYARANSNFARPTLSEQQAVAASQFIEAMQNGGFTPFLLDGVTGSGKTECYFEAVAHALEHDQQVLVLLPEIALTENFLHRFAKRFGEKPILWHSSLKASERRRAWRAIASGEAQVIVGARSALFLPYANLGLIIVDEAHETSFKQDEGVRYNARDVAVIRARFEGIPIILASATPALETMHLADTGTYKRIVLKSRFGGAQMPDVRILNLTQESPERGRWIAPSLLEEMKTRLDKGEQSLLFLNRRGYAPLTLCRHCGYRFQCPNCSAWLVEHRFTHKLACHHCGHDLPSPDACPECSTPDCLVACGPGVERIAEEVSTLLPEARVALVTSDTMASGEKVAEFVANTEAGLIDIIVGTQLVTKGYHFPKLTLVGVIDADLGLEGGDLRAAERTYQQIAQVSGRAGRGDRPGTVYIQTRHPEAPVIAALAANDRDAFYAAETASRRDAYAPPFGRWAAIIISSEDEAEAKEAARALAGTQPRQDDILILGPAPAPMALLRGRYRYRFLINAKRSATVQKTLRAWIKPLRFPQGVRVHIDIDPYSFV